MERGVRGINIFYAVLQLTLVVLWAFGIIKTTFLNFTLVMIPTWGPYVLLLPLKVFEKRLRKKLKKKIDGQRQIR